MVEIVHCTESDGQRWNSFLEECDGASFYHLFGWKSINELCFGHRCSFLAAIRSGSLVGVLPLVDMRSRLFGKILCSMPFVNYGSVCSLDREAESALLSEAKKIVRERNIDYLELRGMVRVNDDLPTREHKVSMMLDLACDADAVWNSFKSKHRTEIRRSYKNGLRVAAGGRELLDAFYAMLVAGWRRMGTPIYQKAYFRTILDVFPDTTRIFVALHDEKPVAAAFNGYYRGVVEGMWLGIDPTCKTLNANNVLYWEMIKHACESGMQVFHFGRSNVGSGGEFFKSKWNASPKQLYWQYYPGSSKSIPQLNVQNPKFSLAIKMWQKLPLRATTLLGPMIARSIP